MLQLHQLENYARKGLKNNSNILVELLKKLFYLKWYNFV